MTRNVAHTPPQEQALEIIEDIYRCKIPIPNSPLEYVMSYLIKSGTGCTIIDAGWDTPESLDAWEAELKQLRLSFEDIAQVVVTHCHPDHYGLAGKLRQICGAKIIMSSLETERLDSRYENYQSLLEEVAEFLTTHGVPKDELHDLQQASLPALNWVVKAMPDQVVDDGDIINTGRANLQVLSTPGHSRGHICLYAENERLLFSGDHVLPTITPNICLNPQSSPNPLRDYLESLSKIEELEVNLVLPAHEFAFSNLGKRLGEIQTHHQDRLSQILSLLNGEPKTAFELAPKVNWDTGPWDTLSDWNRRSAIMETLAHLEYLVQDNRVKRLKTGPIITYTVP